MIEIGRGIKRLRNELGYTQDEFARIAKVGRGYLSDLERDQRNPTAKTMVDLLKNFNISYRDFLIQYCNVKVIPSDDKIETMSKNELEQYMVDLEESEDLNNIVLQTTLYLDDVFKEVVNEDDIYELKENQRRIILDHTHLSDNELYALRVFLETIKSMRNKDNP